MYIYNPLLANTFNEKKNENRPIDYLIILYENIVVDCLNNQTIYNAEAKNKSNISKNEWKTIKSLQKMSSL